MQEKATVNSTKSGTTATALSPPKETKETKNLKTVKQSDSKMTKNRATAQKLKPLPPPSKKSKTRKWKETVNSTKSGTTATALSPPKETKKLKTVKQSDSKMTTNRATAQKLKPLPPPSKKSKTRKWKETKQTSSTPKLKTHFFSNKNTNKKKMNSEQLNPFYNVKTGLDDHCSRSESNTGRQSRLMLVHSKKRKIKNPNLIPTEDVNIELVIIPPSTNAAKTSHLSNKSKLSLLKNSTSSNISKSSSNNKNVKKYYEDKSKLIKMYVSITFIFGFFLTFLILVNMDLFYGDSKDQTLELLNDYRIWYGPKIFGLITFFLVAVLMGFSTGLRKIYRPLIAITFIVSSILLISSLLIGPPPSCKHHSIDDSDIDTILTNCNSSINDNTSTSTIREALVLSPASQCVSKHQKIDVVDVYNSSCAIIERTNICRTENDYNLGNSSTFYGKLRSGLTWDNVYRVEGILTSVQNLFSPSFDLPERGSNEYNMKKNRPNNLNDAREIVEKGEYCLLDPNYWPDDAFGYLLDIGSVIFCEGLFEFCNEDDTVLAHCPERYCKMIDDLYTSLFKYCGSGAGNDNQAQSTLIPYLQKYLSVQIGLLEGEAIRSYATKIFNALFDIIIYANQHGSLANQCPMSALDW
jgi:hypothetical protein